MKPDPSVVWLEAPKGGHQWDDEALRRSLSRARTISWQQFDLNAHAVLGIDEVRRLICADGNSLRGINQVAPMIWPADLCHDGADRLYGYPSGTRRQAFLWLQIWSRRVWRVLFQQSVMTDLGNQPVPLRSWMASSLPAGSHLNLMQVPRHQVAVQLVSRLPHRKSTIYLL